MGDFNIPHEGEPGTGNWSYSSISSILNNNQSSNVITISKQLAQSVIAAAGGIIGSPLAGNVVQSILFPNGTNVYNTTSIEGIANYNKGLGSIGLYTDFRVQPKYGRIRLDGTAGAVNSALSGELKSSLRSAAYAAASVTPGGAYKIFNRQTLYGWGDHGIASLADYDFTARSHVSTLWNPVKKKWIPTFNPTDLINPFRGDKINVVEYNIHRPGNTATPGGRTLKTVYEWKPKLFTHGTMEKIQDWVTDNLDQTSDFIKFYLTGPNLHPGSIESGDIIVFRCILDSLTDNFQANWTDQQMIGRADPNYLYTGFSRSVTFSFSIYATDRDEMKPIWRKLNALASYTAPEYVAGQIAMKGPWMRLTIGDIYVQQPVVITSVDYTMHSSETPWEINIESDATMMQAPKQIEVNISANLIGNAIPQKNGSMYTLAKQFNASGSAKQGNDNWLSDFEDGGVTEKERVAWFSRKEGKSKDTEDRPIQQLIDRIKTKKE